MQAMVLNKIGAAFHRETIRMSGVLAPGRTTGVNWPLYASAEGDQPDRCNYPVGG